MFKVSFIVDPKKLGETFLALAKIGVLDLQHTPLINAKVIRGVATARHGNAGEALVAEMQKRKLDQVDPPMIRELVAAIGFKPNSYSHILSSAMEAGLIHRGEKRGMGYLYIITKRLPAPTRKGGK